MIVKADHCGVAVIASYFPPHVGGLEVVAQEQASDLARNGTRVTVLTTRHSRQTLSVESPADRLRILRMRAVNVIEERTGVPFPLVGFSFFRACLKEFRTCQVVQIHDVFYPTSRLAALAAFIRRKKVVVTQHVGIVDHPNRLVVWVQCIVYRTVGRLLWRQADRIIVYNKRVQQFLRDQGVEETKIHYLSNGVNLDVFKNATPDERRAVRKELGLAPDSTVVLFVGRLVPKKGVNFILEAASDDYEIIIAGSGAIPTDVPQGIKFIGPVERHKLVAYYRAADIFVSPTKGEVFPLTVQEAMASGLPVIMTDDAYYEHFELDRAKILLVKRDSAEIEGAIRAVMSSPDLASDMAAYSRAFASRWFDIQANQVAVRAVLLDRNV